MSSPPIKSYYCYCLVSITGRRTYIGFTTDPKHRLRQHNGEIVGGANSTHAGGPWRIKYLVRGFRTSSEALQFEHAWKHPKHNRFISPTLRKTLSRCDKLKTLQLLCRNPSFRHIEYTTMSSRITH